MLNQIKEALSEDFSNITLIKETETHYTLKAFNDYDEEFETLTAEKFYSEHLEQHGVTILSERGNEITTIHFE